jgi:two-component system, OmpR family, KDP operon response regulator KdpE
MSRVLVVDDEPQLRRALDINLRIRGYHVDLAGNGAEALQLAAKHPPDLVILDLGLPDMDGVEVLHGLRGWTEAPVIVLTVRDSESEKVLALDAGADDYVTKPFGLDELLARVRASLRRAAPAEPDQPVIETPDFSINLAAKKVRSRDGSDIHLTPMEWQLVERLVRAEGRLLTYGSLLEAIWGPGYKDTNILRVHIAHIRRKLEQVPEQPRYFHTEAGMGLRFSRG